MCSSDLKENFDVELHIKIALILNNKTSDNISKWCDKYNLSACPHFDKKHTKFIKRSIRGIYLMNRIGNDVDSRKFIQEIDENRDQDLNNYILLFDILMEKDINNLIRTNENIVRKANNVDCNGKILMDKHNIRGKKIQIVKKKLFNLITEGKLNNKSNEL